MRAASMCIHSVCAPVLSSDLTNNVSSFFVREYNCILWISDADSDSLNLQQTLHPDQEEEAGRIMSLLLKFTKVLKDSERSETSRILILFREICSHRVRW